MGLKSPILFFEKGLDILDIIAYNKDGGGGALLRARIWIRKYS